MRPDWRYEQDSNGFSFWTLARVQPLSVMRPGISGGLHFEEAHYFVFADYLAECWWYAIGLGNREKKETPVVMVGPPIELVADSFSEFLDLYFVDSPKLYPNRGNREK